MKSELNQYKNYTIHVCGHIDNAPVNIVSACRRNIRNSGLKRLHEKKSMCRKIVIK
jgi:hypothetical protein